MNTGWRSRLDFNWRSGGYVGSGKGVVVVGFWVGCSSCSWWTWRTRLKVVVLGWFRVEERVVGKLKVERRESKKTDWESREINKDEKWNGLNEVWLYTPSVFPLMRAKWHSEEVWISWLSQSTDDLKHTCVSCSLIDFRSETFILHTLIDNSYRRLISDPIRSVWSRSRGQERVKLWLSHHEPFLPHGPQRAFRVSLNAFHTPQSGANYLHSQEYTPFDLIN